MMSKDILVEMDSVFTKHETSGEIYAVYDSVRGVYYPQLKLSRYGSYLNFSMYCEGNKDRLKGEILEFIGKDDAVARLQADTGEVVYVSMSKSKEIQIEVCDSIKGSLLTETFFDNYLLKSGIVKKYA